MLKFTKDHEWVRVEGDVAMFGITPYASEMLGDVVFVELPAIGKVVAQSDPAAVVESVKAASDVYAPISGSVVETNAAIIENPKLVNDDPMGAGWFAKIKLTDRSQLDGLMDEQAYKASLTE
jgi:glycine cleavage system H protein